MSSKPTFRQRYKAMRKRILAFTPFVRRNRHERAMERADRHWRKYLQEERKARTALGRIVFSPPPLATVAQCALPVAIKSDQANELCIFVTYAPTNQLKPHVVDHVNALLAAGVDVLLVANTDEQLAEFKIPMDLATRLYGCLVRENVGYDFAAWAHAYAMIDPTAIKRRLYLINDSIVGPLDLDAYRALLQRVRDAAADLIGMTSNPDPQPHLQSYYLVFNERLLRSAVFDSFMRRIVNMPTKGNVIDCYEIWLSPTIEQSGFAVSTIFPSISTERAFYRNDTIVSWRQLVDLGFPFIKSEVLRDPERGQAAGRLLPDRYR